MRVVRAALVLTAVWGVLLTLGLWTGRVPQAWLERMHASAPVDRKPRTCACDKPNVAAPTAAPSATDVAAPVTAVEVNTEPAPHAIDAMRYPVCEREEAAPALSRVRLSKNGPELWALHCGPSVHLFAIDRDGEQLRPTRVARLDAPSYSPAEAPRAVPVVAADIDGDGRADLLAPVLLLDRAGAPSAGALYLLRQRAEGGFEPASRLLDLAPGGVAPATLDTQPGADLALLQLHDPHTARPNELWFLHGGPAPLRFGQREAGNGSGALAAVDLDRDGIDDLAVASPSEGRLRLWLSSRGALPQVEPVVLALPHVREAIAADLDGDGQRDLVLTGDQVWFLLAQKAFVPEPKAITGSEGLRDVQLEDVNADGKPDVIGYAHPTIVSLLQGPGLAFTRRTWATLQGEPGVLFVRVAELDADGQPDLVIVSVSHLPDGQVELALARDLAETAAVRLSPQTQTFRDAALLQQIVLP